MSSAYFPKALLGLGGAMAIISTVTAADAIAPLLAGLAPEGRLVVLGIGKDPLAVAMGSLVSGERMVLGSIIGSPYESERTLDFSVLTGARPVIETLPLDRANEAYQKMLSGQVKFRMVLTMTDQSNSGC